MSVYIVGTLDTKGREVAFVRDVLAKHNVDTQVIDAGCIGPPAIDPDVCRDRVFAAAGTTLDELRDQGDRGKAISAAADGVTRLIRDAHDEGLVDGVLALGGSAGTTIGTSAMRALPLGVPKVMVSTLASGQTRPYVDGKDILMLNSVVDISGINRISRTVLGAAARAMAGMVTLASEPPQALDDRPLVAATMFGVTTPCVQHAQQILEEAGYEVLVFHATGNGGESMEALIDDGLIAGVLDLTTTELADELVGGILSAGPNRLTAAGRRGIPQVISVGATDMVNFGPSATVPERFRDRQFYQHNPTVTLMRTTPDECRRIGEEIGEKASQSRGPVTILLPRKGVSAIDCTGEPFDDSEAREALFAGIERGRSDAAVVSLDSHINDPEFAETAARMLIDMLRAAGEDGS